MKHLIRAETAAGLALLPASRLPNRLRIQHQGSGQEFRFPLHLARPGRQQQRVRDSGSRPNWAVTT